MKIIQIHENKLPIPSMPVITGTVVEVGVLQTGDYSLHGLTDRIALERKAFQTCGTLTAEE